MDTLCFGTVPNDDGTYTVRWKHRCHTAKQLSHAGDIKVAFPQGRWDSDRHILAELTAIHHLLEVEQICGSNRNGKQLYLNVSAGAIKKALAKGTLKKTDRGNTDKHHVALFTKFLATKYFEAEVKVLRADKWVEEEPKHRLDASIQASGVPNVYIDSPVGPLIISRHALNRLVGRKMYKDGRKLPDKSGDELLDVPDHKWSAAWAHLQKVLPAAITGRVTPQEHRRVVRKYGTNPIYLWHQDSQMVYVVVREPYGLEVVTAVHDEYWIAANIPMQYGQHLKYGSG